MSINLSADILNLEGAPLQDGFTVGSACIQALITALPADEKLGGGEKVKLFVLASKLQAAGDSVDLAAEETALIKERSGKLFTALVVGRIWQAIDPASVAA